MHRRSESAYTQTELFLPVLLLLIPRYRRHYTYTIIYKHSIDNFDFVAIIKKKKKKWWKKKREEGKGKRSED